MDHISKLKKIKQNIKHLDFLSICKPQTRQAVINKADKELIYVICEIVLNVLNGSIKIDETLIRQLKPYKKCLRKLVTNTPISTKKKILNQKGAGWMTFLIPPVIQTVKEILNL